MHNDRNNVLDQLITSLEHSELLGKTGIHNLGCSDHKLVNAEVNISCPSTNGHSFTNHNVKIADPVISAARLNTNSVFTVPADVNKFTVQLNPRRVPQIHCMIYGTS